MSDIKWIRIKSSEEEYQIELLKQLLEDNQIPAVVIDKKGSAYVMIGESHLMVPEDHVEKAKALLVNQAKK